MGRGEHDAHRDALREADQRRALRPRRVQNRPDVIASFLQRRHADVPVAARVIGELATWFAWHRHEDRDAALYDDKTVRRTVIGFICAALVPERASENKHQAERTMRHADRD